MDVRPIAPGTVGVLAHGRLRGRRLEEEHILTVAAAGQEHHEPSVRPRQGVGDAVLRHEARVRLGQTLAILRHLRAEVAGGQSRRPPVRFDTITA